MLAVIEVIILPGAVLLLVAFAVLHEWGLKRLRWRQLTGDNCRRYLMAKGWHCLDYNDNSAVMDKGICMSSSGAWRSIPQPC